MRMLWLRSEEMININLYMCSHEPLAEVKLQIPDLQRVAPTMISQPAAKIRHRVDEFIRGRHVTLWGTHGDDSLNEAEYVDE